MPPISPRSGIIQQAEPSPAIGQVTQYAYPGDKYSDKLTRQKLGMVDNILTPHAAALTQSMQDKIHANNGDVIMIVDDKGNKRYSYFADRAPEVNPRVDLYQPQGYDESIADYQKVVNLGGGSAKLRGQALADAGEANVQKYLNSPASTPTQSMPPPDPIPAQGLDLTSYPSQQIPLPAPALGIAPSAPIMHNPAQAQMNQPPQSQDDDAILGRLYSRFNYRHPILASLSALGQ